MGLTVLSAPLGGICDGTDYSGGAGGSVQFHLDSDQWAVVTGYEKHKEKDHNDIYVCKPVVQKQDSSSCN